MLLFIERNINEFADGWQIV